MLPIDPGKYGNFFLENVVFKVILQIEFMCIFWECEYHKTHWWEINVGSGSGLVPSVTKPVHEPMLTQIYIPTWPH